MGTFFPTLIKRKNKQCLVPTNKIFDYYGRIVVSQSGWNRIRVSSARIFLQHSGAVFNISHLWHAQNGVAAHLLDYWSNYILHTQRGITATHCKTHFAKRPSDLKRNGTQEKTPFSGTVFHTLSHGVLHLVAGVSFKNHWIEASDWLWKNFIQS